MLRKLNPLVKIIFHFCNWTSFVQSDSEYVNFNNIFWSIESQGIQKEIIVLIRQTPFGRSDRGYNGDIECQDKALPTR